MSRHVCGFRIRAESNRTAHSTEPSDDPLSAETRPRARTHMHLALGRSPSSVYPVFSLAYLSHSAWDTVSRHSRHCAILSVMLPAKISHFHRFNFRRCDNSVRHPRTRPPCRALRCHRRCLTSLGREHTRSLPRRSPRRSTSHRRHRGFVDFLASTPDLLEERQKNGQTPRAAAAAATRRPIPTESGF